MTEIAGAVAAELARLRAENTRLLKMLELSPRQANGKCYVQASNIQAVNLRLTSQLRPCSNPATPRLSC